ncbi:MAG: TolC family protein [Planctomycetaceae bacterium]|nr:TolC family protein [Planctomycetaceae bacterium]
MPAASGCRLFSRPDVKQAAAEANIAHYQDVATQIEYPTGMDLPNGDLAASGAPISIAYDGPIEYWDLRLEEVMHMALGNTKVLRDLGGLMLRSPDSAVTWVDPAVQETDPQSGMEAALSAFDATFANSTFAENNDRGLNNSFFGGGIRKLKQDLMVSQSQITKRAATGTEFTVRQNTQYDANNAPANLMRSFWESMIETEFRHPLLRGGGVEFNRIAGPSDDPGVMNGVLLARINNDISLTDFEMAIRDYVSNVENAYWDLYFAYRDLEARRTARDAALETWRRIQALNATGRRGGEAEKEAQAREQYFRFEEEVQNALTGRIIDGTRTSNGSRGGTFRGYGVSPGVHVAERRLRLLIGLPINDGRMIRPAQEPELAAVEFDWHEVLQESLMRRTELRRQKWLIRRRELEMKASKNFLLPQLDAIARYRWRGIGKDLFYQDDNLTLINEPDNLDRSEIDNAWDSLFNGDFQEWQLGAEMSFTFGNRRALAGVRNAELRLSRERAILREQEREIVHDISNAISDMDRAYATAKTNLNRRVAARQQLAAVTAAFEADTAPLDLVLEAQRRVAEADSRYHASFVEYMIALKNVHFEKGSLLDYNAVGLSEGSWPKQAYSDAEARDALRSRPLNLFGHQPGEVVSSGHVLRGTLIHNPPVPGVPEGEIPPELLNPEHDPEGAPAPLPVPTEGGIPVEEVQDGPSLGAAGKAPAGARQAGNGQAGSNQQIPVSPLARRPVGQTGTFRTTTGALPAMTSPLRNAGGGRPEAGRIQQTSGAAGTSAAGSLPEWAGEN